MSAVVTHCPYCCRRDKLWSFPSANFVMRGYLGEAMSSDNVHTADKEGTRYHHGTVLTIKILS